MGWNYYLFGTSGNIPPYYFIAIRNIRTRKYPHSIQNNVKPFEHVIDPSHLTRASSIVSEYHFLQLRPLILSQSNKRHCRSPVALAVLNTAKLNSSIESYRKLVWCRDEQGYQPHRNACLLAWCRFSRRIPTWLARRSQHVLARPPPASTILMRQDFIGRKHQLHHPNLRTNVPIQCHDHYYVLTLFELTWHPLIFCAGINENEANYYYNLSTTLSFFLPFSKTRIITAT